MVVSQESLAAFLEYSAVLSLATGVPRGVCRRRFRCSLSNPPWEHVELKEQEFLSARDAHVASAGTQAERSRLILELLKQNPSLHHEYTKALRVLDSSRFFLGRSNRYPHTGRGRINTYAVFAELSRGALNSRGRSGVVVPSGIAFADTTKHFFGELMQRRTLVSLFSFFEIRKWFPGTDSREPFCLLTIRGEEIADSGSSIFVFNARSIEDLRRPGQTIHVIP